MKISDDLIKNDVPAEGQLADDDCIRFTYAENADLRVLFIGNSITRHGVAEHIGWHGDYGMAASFMANDYVHRTVAKLEADGHRVSFCTANYSDLERTLDLGLLETKYGSAAKFCADIVVFRIGENADLANSEAEFETCYARAADFYASRGAKIVITDLFWECEPFDDFVEKFARSHGYGFASIHDLGNRDDMKATGLFEHRGVALHPGDKGMEEIASRICEVLKTMI